MVWAITGAISLLPFAIHGADLIFLTQPAAVKVSYFSAMIKVLCLELLVLRTNSVWTLAILIQQTKGLL
jgi:hypothetical protein